MGNDGSVPINTWVPGPARKESEAHCSEVISGARVSVFPVRQKRVFLFGSVWPPDGAAQALLIAPVGDASALGPVGGGPGSLVLSSIQVVRYSLAYTGPNGRTLAIFQSSCFCTPQVIH